MSVLALFGVLLIVWSVGPPARDRWARVVLFIAGALCVVAGQLGRAS